MEEQGIDTTDHLAYRRAPVLLGRVTTIDGEKLDEAIRPASEERWVTRSEDPDDHPGRQARRGACCTQGQWWPSDYSGPPLVSVEEGAAKGLGLKVGSRVGLRIFMLRGRGRGRLHPQGRLDRLRRQRRLHPLAGRRSKGFSPAHAAIVRIPPEKEEAVVAAVAERFPRVLVFQVRRTLETAVDLFAQVSLIVTALASVVLVAGVLVLFGAFAAAARRRRRESALLKVFGATRPAILFFYAFEFALAALLAVLLGVGFGAIAAHPIVIFVFEADWRLRLGAGAHRRLSSQCLPPQREAPLVGWSTLSHRPARVLRSA